MIPFTRFPFFHHLYAVKPPRRAIRENTRRCRHSRYPTPKTRTNSSRHSNPPHNFDQLKLHRQAYRVICCSNRIKYRLELFLAGVEDGNHYSLAERQLFLRSYLSNWDNLTPQRITTIRIPNHHIYELAGGVYGLIPTSSPNTMRFYRLPSVSRRIEMEEWSVSDLDFSIDDFAMECAYDLLTVFTYKTGQYVYHFLP